MNLVRIRGSADVLRALGDIPGLFIETETAHPEEGGGWNVSAHATDAAITEAQTRGATVDVIMNNAEMDSHLAQVLAQVQRTPGGSAPASPDKSGSGTGSPTSSGTPNEGP